MINTSVLREWAEQELSFGLPKQRKMQMNTLIKCCDEIDELRSEHEELAQYKAMERDGVLFKAKVRGRTVSIEPIIASLPRNELKSAGEVEHEANHEDD